MTRRSNASNKTTRVETQRHKEATRTNIPTAELEGLVGEDESRPTVTDYAYRNNPDEDPELYRRNPDLDPQLVWRGKDEQDRRGLKVDTVPIYIQEKVHPKAIIDDLRRRSAAKREAETDEPDLFADFNGVEGDEEAKLEFYEHQQNWTNRMILGDALQVMTSLAEKEALKGQVQAIYIDPPYGIKFNSNWQVSTKDLETVDGKKDSQSREPDVIKAFRDTWNDGVASYISYLRDRLIVSRELLTESGSIFVQIGVENSHLVRSVLDEVFGSENFISQINFAKTSSSTGVFLPQTYDCVLWYAKTKEKAKYRTLYLRKNVGETGATGYNRVEFPCGFRRTMARSEKDDPDQVPDNAKIYFRDNLTSQSVGRRKGEGAASWFPVEYRGKTFKPSQSVRWKTNQEGMDRLLKANRIDASEKNLGYVRYFDDFPFYPISDVWMDTVGQNQFGGDKIYVVQTGLTVVKRCILMSSDPGDIVLESDSE